MEFCTFFVLFGESNGYKWPLRGTFKSLPEDPIELRAVIRCFGPEQLPDSGDIGGTVSISKEAIVTDAVLAFRQDV